MLYFNQRHEKPRGQSKPDPASDYIPLSTLPDVQKQALWHALKTERQADAQLMAGLKRDAFAVWLIERYGARVAMQRGEIEGLLYDAK